ncbi:MAG: hypothetical protein V7631_2583 [Massilia sp.]
MSISIDDFGTGYSSLSALRNFAVDKLKIDPSFVHEIEAVPSAAAAALAVISFGRKLDMRVNAEGVETAGQARSLKQHGCDEIQGYLLSRPCRARRWRRCSGRGRRRTGAGWVLEKSSGGLCAAAPAG